MLVWLLHRFSPLLEKMEVLSSGDSRVFLTARIALASVTSFVTAILLGPFAIRWLKGRFRERIDSNSKRLNQLQAKKQSTPTMGGLFIVAAIILSSLIWGDLENRYLQLGILTAFTFGLLGAIDDCVKLKTSRNGITVLQKLGTQIVLSLLIGTLLYFKCQQQPGGPIFYWPFGNFSLYLGGGFILWAALVIVGTSNAVNLTDGLDGLASGCTIFTGASFVALTYLAGHIILAEYLSIPYIAGCGELGIAMGSMVGAVLGFLWFNCYPAQVFMGDTGALPIGALLALSALITHQEILLVIIGGVFVIETLSVIVQLGWHRLTGHRIIECSPLHNHYLICGHHEMKIVVRFWISSALLAILGITSLKIM